MKTNRITGIIVLIKGIIMVLLGIFHIIAIFILENNKLKGKMSELLCNEYVLWFVVGGIFFIFIGIIDIISYRGIKSIMNWAWEVAFASSVFCVLSSILGIVVFKQGSPFLIFVLGLLEIIPLILYRKEFKSPAIA